MPRPPANKPELPPAMTNRAITAAIWELPAPGIHWPHEARESWFELFRKTVEVVYGPLRPSGERIAGTGPAIGATFPASAIGMVASSRFCIEPDGTASRDGYPIDPQDIPGGTVVHDYRPQPVDEEYHPVMWKSHGAKKLPLPAGVAIRSATDEWRGRGSTNGEATT